MNLHAQVCYSTKAQLVPKPYIIPYPDLEKN